MRLDHVGVNVADLAKAEAWYCAAFGLERELAVRIDAAGLDIVMLRHAQHGHRVELLHRPGGSPGLRAVSPAEAALTEGYGHIAFDVPDLDAALAWAEKCPAAQWGAVEIRPSAIRFAAGSWVPA